MNDSFKYHKIALPQEHGAWGFFLEPIILSLFVAYSLNGLLIAIAAFFLFLIRQPLKNIIRHSSISFRKLYVSQIFLLVYFLMACIAIFVPLLVLPIEIFIPFGITLAVMFVFVVYEAIVKKKNFIIELIAPIAIDFLSLTILFAAGWDLSPALAFFLLLLSRSVQSAIYVHINLQKIKGKPINNIVLHVTNIIFSIALVLLIISKLLPPLSLLAFAILVARSYNIFNHGKLNVKGVGLKEFIYGAVFVVINIIAFNL